GARLRHAKPHGALYNLAARELDTARAIADAVREIDRGLRLYALAGSDLAAAGRSAGLQGAEEAFAERGYAADGRLAPRGRRGAGIGALGAALALVRGLVREHAVQAIDGSRIALRADALCLHGERHDAAAFARALREALEAEGIVVRAPG